MTTRRGFTLLELLVTLAVSGIALLGAMALLDQLTDSGSRIVHRGALLARRENGWRLLLQLTRDARTSSDTLDRFRGDARSAEFSSVCTTPGGWMEPCRVSLAVDTRGDSSVIVAQLTHGPALETTRHAGSADLRYYDPASRDSSWLSQWTPSLTMPAAIAVVIHADTVVYPLGARR